MANRRATELFDAPEATLVGRSIPDFCADTPAGREAAERLEQRLRDGEPVRDDEVELCLTDGTRIWVSLTMRPVDEARNDGAERLVMMVDVTERRRMETALREARDELETRVEERTGELERANERLERRTRRLKALRDIDQAILAAGSPKEIATATLRRTHEIVPFHRASVSIIEWDEDQARVLATRQEGKFLDSGTTIPLDEFYLTEAMRAGETEVIPDLAAEPQSGTAAKIRDLDVRSVLSVPMMVEEDLIGLLQIGRTRPDAFTERDWQIGRELADHMAVALRQSQLLEEVQAQRERLEERVQERTAELESFTYSVSHDLRTPLRAIDGYTKLLESNHADQLDDEGRRLLGVVRDSTQKMSTLIDDLLTLSRLGRREMDPAPLDLEPLTRDAYEEACRTRSGSENGTFEVHSLPDAVGDPSMMRHVMANLLGNAVKFSRDEEAPHIEVGGEANGDASVFFVHDNGVGFDMEFADKVFGVFERLHDETQFEGTGVGLAIVERIIQRHDGEVWAESVEGEGTTIYFSLPNDHDDD